MEERRLDDGEDYTWSEFSTYYKKVYTKKEIAAYWETCKMVKASKSSLVHVMATEESLAQTVDVFTLAQPADIDNSEAASTCIPARFRDILEMMDIYQNDIPLVFEVLDGDRSGDISHEVFVAHIHYIRHVNTHTLLAFIMKRLEKVADLSFSKIGKRGQAKAHIVACDIVTGKKCEELCLSSLNMGSHS